MRSVYIHIPFCKSICSYCDFCKIFYNESLVDKYLDSLQKEIKKYYKKDKIETIYIGGGTPSTLNLKQLNKLFEILKIFELNKDYEFTFECNINDLDEKKLKILYDNKVNRLSIGIQSFISKNIKFLNRESSDVKQKIDMAKRIGFKNINVDLMYALKDET